MCVFKLDALKDTPTLMVFCRVKVGMSITGSLFVYAARMLPAQSPLSGAAGYRTVQGLARLKTDPALVVLFNKSKILLV